MKKFTIKPLLIAAALCLGTSAWAYEIPEGFEVKQVLLGTINAEGNVDPETFEADNAVVADWTNKNNFSIVDLTEENLSVWSSLSLNMSGKVMRLGSRTTHQLDFSQTIASGKIVFGTDFYVGTHSKTISFIGSNDEIVAKIAFPDKSENNRRVNGVPYLTAEGYADATISGDYVINDTYLGTRNREYQISEVLIDLDNGILTYSGKIMDRRKSNNIFNVSATISYPTGISGIKGVKIDATACGSNKYYAYFDNMKLYSVNTAVHAYDLTLNAVTTVDGNKKVLSSTVYQKNIPSGETIQYPVAKYIISDGILYEAKKNDGAYYVGEITINSNDPVEITYNKVDLGLATPIYFADFGTAIGTNKKEANYLRASGGSTTSTNSSIEAIPAGELADGIYTFELGNYKNRTAKVKVGDYEIGRLSVGGNSGVYVTSRFTNVVVKDGVAVTIVPGGSSYTDEVDYILAIKTGELETNVNVGSNGIATFTPSVALDFTNATNIKAYTATVSETTVTLTETKTVAAGEGVIIKSVNGGEAEETIAVTNPVTATEGNALVGTLVDIYPLATDETINEVTYTNYILNNGSNGIGFYKANNKKVAAGKAYLRVRAETVAEAKALTIVWNDGETTGIKDNYEFGTMNSDAATFDLSGRKVANPAKGLYIKNGKKFIVK